MPCLGPVERVLLRTQGDLQPTLSRYVGEPVDVDVCSQVRRDGRILRRAHLVARCSRRILCRATTDVLVADPRIERHVIDGQVGLGEILRRLGSPAHYTLLDRGAAARSFWRRYRLEGDGFRFDIDERFPRAVFTDAPRSPGADRHPLG